MKIKLEQEDVKILEKAEKIVGFGEREGEYTTLDDLIGTIDNLIYEVHSLEEKLEDKEKEIEDNYEPIRPGYSYYGVSERDFY